MDRLARWAPLSGILAVALLVIGWLLMAYFVYYPDAERAAELVSADPLRFQRGAVFVGVYAGTLFIWFAGCLAAAIRKREPHDDFLASIAFGGAIVMMIGASIFAAIIYEASRRFDRDPSVGAAHVLVEQDIASNVLSVLVSVGMAALLGATGVHALRSRLLPGWLAWASIVSAVGLLTPVHYVFMLVGLVWIAIVSVILYRHPGAEGQT